MPLLAPASAEQICSNQADAYFCSQRFVFPALKCLQHSIAVTHNILPKNPFSMKWGKNKFKEKSSIIIKYK